MSRRRCSRWGRESVEFTALLGMRQCWLLGVMLMCARSLLSILQDRRRPLRSLPYQLQRIRRKPELQ